MQFAIYIHAVIVVVSVEGYEWKVSAGFVITEFCLAGYGSLKYQFATASFCVFVASTPSYVLSMLSQS